MSTLSLRRWMPVLSVLAVFAFAAGCEDFDRRLGNKPAQSTTGTTVVAPTILAPDNSLPKQSSTTNSQNTPSADPSAQATNEPMSPATSEGELKKPEDADFAKGQGYGDNFITQPVREYFNLQYRIMFDQMTHQLNFFKALNNRYPKDLDEYKKEIMEPKGYTELPELRPGDEYHYDPKDGQLYIKTKSSQ